VREVSQGVIVLSKMASRLHLFVFPATKATMSKRAFSKDMTEFATVMALRLSRRNLLRGGAALAGGSVTSGVLGIGLLSPSSGALATMSTALGFSPVPKSLEDRLLLPPGYRYTVICALGDPLQAKTPPFRNDGLDLDFEHRFGDHHDGMEFFGLGAHGRPDPSASQRALIGLNHEATTDERRSSFFVHADGGRSDLPRPAAEVDKEMALHGISVFEVRRSGNDWRYVVDSPFNARIHLQTGVQIHGPARGNALLRTRYSPQGTQVRGTLNNCGTGRTPWGTLLSGEENWAGYFARADDDDARRRNDRSVIALQRYGRPQGAASRHGWESAGTEQRFARWDVSVRGARAEEDYRNEMNAMGYIVEVDPYAMTRPPRKRTALGRFAHEAAAFSKPVAGQPLAVYQGDDARGEYIYKWISAVAWDPADAVAADRLAVGDKYLDHGSLYVARFNSDGRGVWIPLALSNPLIAGYSKYAFADLADVCIHARLAADAVGATRMDRPEWSAVNPANGEVYFTLTNNSKRTVESADAANPRAYQDLREDIKAGKINKGNVHGHILRLREEGDSAAATTFAWDVYLFGAEASAEPAINLSGLNADQDFSSPDGLVFSPATGICWIQTDDSAYTDVTNGMMLAALPGQVGDGGPVRVAGTQVVTPVGRGSSSATLRRFLVGPKGCEITGVCESPDGTALFVNIQHPGENTAMADVNAPDLYESQWPANAGYGAGRRPRSATVVITRIDGGRIGT